MNNTWIKLFRKFREWEWYQDSNVSRLFLELLLTVNVQDKKWQGINIKRGQILTGIEELGKRIGLNRQQTRSAIDRLISTKEITKSSTATYTIITINNYSKYQTVTKLVTNEQPSSNQVVTTTKEYKNIRSKETTTMSGNFLLKWNVVFGTKYTSTVQIDKPLTEWLKSYSLDDIFKAVENIKYDNYWKDKELDPLWLLRFKDKTGDIDRIGRLLNVKKIQENIRL